MMTRNPSKRRALIQYALALPIFILLASFLATPDNIVLKKTADLSTGIENLDPKKPLHSERLVGSTSELKIESKTPDEMPLILQKNPSDSEKANVLPNETFDMPSASQSMRYDAVSSPIKESYKSNTSVIILQKDTTERPYSELSKIDPNTIARIEMNKMTPEKTTILVIYKDNRVEKFYATPSELKGLNTFTNSSQTHSPPSKQLDSDVFTVVEEQPVFPNGSMELFRWLGKNVKYPTIARQSGHEGTVYIGFVVEKDGSISNITVKRGLKMIQRDTFTFIEANNIKGNKTRETVITPLDDEAKRVIATMPKWTPGKQSGKPVRVAYTLPIKFKLE